MARYSIKSVSLSPPHFKWATTRMRLRASLHRVFSTLMCFLNERCESHHSPRNFVDSSTGRSVFPILTMGGLWARARGAVKCTTLHLWAANLKPLYQHIQGSTYKFPTGWFQTLYLGYKGNTKALKIIPQCSSGRVGGGGVGDYPIIIFIYFCNVYKNN